MWQWLIELITSPNHHLAGVALFIGSIAILSITLLIGASMFGIRQRRPLQQSADRYSQRKFYRLARQFKLGTKKADLLLRLSHRYGIMNPTILFTNFKLTEALLLRAVTAIEHRTDLPDQDRQFWLSKYFRIEELLERNAANDPQRMHRRKIVDRACVITPAQSEAYTQSVQNSTEEVPPLILLSSNQRIMGTIIDVSSGGCAVYALSQVDIVRLFRIEFQLSRYSRIAVIGKVCHIRAQAPAGAIMHVQFTNLPLTHRNNIHRFIYGKIQRDEHGAFQPLNDYLQTITKNTQVEHEAIN